MDHEKKEKDYNPPGWLVTRINGFELDPDRAQRFNDFRVRLCETLGKDNETCKISNLCIKAIDLLLEHEGALLAKVEYEIYNVQDSGVEQPVQK